MKYAPYSFSKINTFYSCPKKFEWTYISKKDRDETFVDPSFFQRGRFIHNYIANRLLGGSGNIKGFNTVDVDDKMALVECADIALNNEYLVLTYEFDKTSIETQIKLDSSFKSTESNYIFKGYIDYFAVQDNLAVIVDWKSGKKRKNSIFSQLELYAIWLLDHYPEVDEIDLMFYYIEHDSFEIKTINQNDIEMFKGVLSNKIDEIETTNEFKINPSKQCEFCPFFNSCISEFNI